MPNPRMKREMEGSNSNGSTPASRNRERSLRSVKNVMNASPKNRLVIQGFLNKNDGFDQSNASESRGTTMNTPAKSLRGNEAQRNKQRKNAKANTRKVLQEAFRKK